MRPIHVIAAAILPVLACLAPLARAQKEQAPPSTAGVHPFSAFAAALPATDLRFDEPGDGSVRALAGSYEAEFSARGATYVPFFGSKAPADHPFGLALAAVWSGEQALTSAAEVAPARTGSRIVYDRGGVFEIYEARADGVEQIFVVTRAGAGELRLRIAVDSPLAYAGESAGLLFAAPGLGAVRYGLATAFDRAGKRSAVPAQFRDGAIELCVPASFMARALLPVTVDPFITTVFVENSTADTFFADVAVMDSLGQALVCYEYAFSAASHGVYVVRFSLVDGTVLGAPVQVATGTDNWRLPKIAYNEAGNQFLVVAEAGASGSRTIRGRTLDGTSSYPGAPFTISTGASGSEFIKPDVGGDPNPQGPTNFCVVFEAVYSSTDHDIWARLVTASGGLYGGAPIAVDYTSFNDRNPCVAKSNGQPPAASQAWTVVWDRELSMFSSDVHGTQLGPTGALLHPNFAIENVAMDGSVPAVSTVTDESTGGRRYLVVWMDYWTINDNDLWGVVMQGATALTPITNLSELQVPGDAEYQYHPAVDSDGFRFAVAYAESYQGSSTDYDIYAATLHYNPATAALGVSEGHRNLAYTSSLEDSAQVAAVRTAGSNPAVDSTRYAVVWDREVTSSDHDVFGAIYEGTTGAGGHEIVVTTCGNNWPALAAYGVPALGQTVAYELTLGGMGWPLMLIGTYGFYQLCPGTNWCALGLNPIWMIATPVIAGQIPADPALLGLDIYVQGFEVLPNYPLGCVLPVMPSVTIRTRIE